MIYAFLLAFFGIWDNSGSESRVVVTYLANAGVLISSDETSILIDALFTDHYPQYPSPDSALVQAMIQGSEKFEGLDFHLITHSHEDHFNSDLLQQQLAAQKKLLVITSNQVKRVLPEQVQSRVKNENFYFDMHELVIRPIPVRHINPVFKDVENLAYLIRIGGKKILHMGDAATDPENLQLLPKDKIDLVILPYFVLNNEANTDAMMKQLGQPVLMLLHIETGYAEKLRSQIPNALPGIKTVVPGDPYEGYVLN